MSDARASRNDRIDAAADTAAAAAAAGFLRGPEVWIGALVLAFPFVMGVAPNLALALACGAGTLAWCARSVLARRAGRPTTIVLCVCTLALLAWVLAGWPAIGRQLTRMGAGALVLGALLATVTRRGLLLWAFWFGCVGVTLPLWAGVALVPSAPEYVLAETATTAMILVLAATGSLAVRWRNRVLVEVASAAAVVYLVAPDIHGLTGLATPQGFGVFADFFTAGVMVAVVYAAGRIGRHVVRGAPDTNALAQCVTWAQVRPWVACGALAGASATLLFMLLLWEHAGSAVHNWVTRIETRQDVISEIYTDHVWREMRVYDALRLEMRHLVLGLSLVLTACSAHLTLRARDTFTRAAPLGAALLAMALLVAGDLLLRVSVGIGDWFRAEILLAAVLLHAWAVISVGFFSRDPGRRGVLPIVLIALAGCWWIRWIPVESESYLRDWGDTLLLWACVLPLGFHAAVASRLSPSVRASHAILLVSACGGAALAVEHAYSHPRTALFAAVALAFLIVLASPLVAVARRARSLCAVPADHPIVSDHLGGHPAARPE